MLGYFGFRDREAGADATGVAGVVVVVHVAIAVDKPEVGSAGHIGRTQRIVVRLIPEELHTVPLNLEEIELNISNITSLVNAPVSAEHFGVGRNPELIDGLILTASDFLDDSTRRNHRRQIIGKQTQQFAVAVLA